MVALLARVRVLVSGGDRKWSLARACVLFPVEIAHGRSFVLVFCFPVGNAHGRSLMFVFLFTGWDRTWSLTLVDLFPFVSSGRG